MELNEKQKVAWFFFLFTGLLLVFNEHVPQEMVFPANAAYTILTFYLTYSESSIFRHYIFSFLLSFVEVCWISVLKSLWKKDTKFHDPLNSEFFILFIEFFVIFVAIRMMTKKEIYNEFKNSTLRVPLFILKGYFKARTLIFCLRIVTQNGPSEISQVQFLTGIACAGALSASPAVIYILDSFLCCDISVKEIGFDGVYKLAKSGVLFAALSMTIELFVPANFEIKFGYSFSSLVIYLSYIAEYSVEAFKYSKNFNR